MPADDNLIDAFAQEGRFTEMAEKELHVQMLGGFSMYYGDEAIALNKIGGSKSLRLLQILLLSRRSGISKNELMDYLYGWNEKAAAVNRNKNLNNLIYRLKGQLISCGLPDSEYIKIREGMCWFKPEFPVVLDTEVFEETVETVKKMRGGAERFAFLRMDEERYSGELLPTNLSETWFFQKSRRFKELYVLTIQELEKIFKEKKDYQNRINLYIKASAIYPFDNWQVQLIRCYLEIYQYEEALKVYNDTSELYAREMSIAPTEEMQECFETLELLDENHTRNPRDIGGWRDLDRAFQGRKNDIERLLFEERHIKGAYYCTYPSFVDYCRLIVRSKERSEISAILMFLTLSQKKKISKTMNLSEQMQILKSAIGDSLRTGDAYTRYGNRHFILMLTKTELKYCSTIFRRIEESYARNYGKGDLWYYADMTQELKDSSF